MQKIKEITKNLKIIDYNYNHNQFLDVLDCGKIANIKTPEILINFDMHSDIYISSRTKLASATIANWVNECLANNPTVSTVYWVLPKTAAKDIHYRFELAKKNPKIAPKGFPLCGNTNLNIFNFKFFISPIYIKPFEQYFLIDNQTGLMFEIAKKKEKDNYFSHRLIKVITCCENNLPNFKNKNVLLSIDADYFANSGYDTKHDLKFDKSEKEIKKAFNSLLKTLVKKNIRPELISLTVSPIYLPLEHQETVINFYKDFIKYSGKEKALNEYTRTRIR